MSLEVLINMKNRNALIAIAHFSENSRNPYAVFCEYIKYCLSLSSTDNMTITELGRAVEAEFGIRMPKHILARCMMILEKEQFLEQTDDLIHRIGSFDADRFDEMRSTYRRQEEALVLALVSFVRQYSLNWDIDTARSNLVSVLDGEHLAYDIRLRNDQGKTEKSNLLGEASEIDLSEISTIDVDSDDSLTDEEINEQPMFPARIFVGKFLLEALEKDGTTRDCLLRVCEGILVCTGAYQLLGNEEYTTKPFIYGTDFFFDTRLLLRCVGCAGEAAVASARELKDMIIRGGGHIYYYDHTWDEVETALGMALKSLEKGMAPLDYEMRLYALQINNDPTVLSTKLSGLRMELESMKIFLRTPEVYSDKERLQISFDENDFKLYLKQNNWRDAVAKKDASSVWNTHMRRGGRYNAFYGTNDRLCVFVTTTTKLARMTLAYQHERPQVSSISMWKRNHQPVITDVQLMCRLWSPEVDTERISLLRLTANAVAAQRPTRKYFDEMTRLVEQLKAQIPEASGICLSEYFGDQMTENILELVGDDEGKFDLGILSSSFAEITEAKAVREAERTKVVEAERDSLQNELNDQTHRIINSANQRLCLMPPVQTITGIILIWLDVFFGAITVIVTVICSIVFKTLALLWIDIIPVLWILVDRIFSNGVIKKTLIRKWLPKAKKKYTAHITTHLYDAEQPYEHEIVAKCISNNRILSICQKIV